MLKISVERVASIPDGVAAVSALSGEPGVFLLDSSDGNGWSYVGARPAWTWRGSSLSDWQRFKDEARPLIDAAPGDLPVPFPAGLMGALSYDFGLLLEGVGSRHPQALDGAPLFSFGFYESVLAIDPVLGEAWLCGQRGSTLWKMLERAVKATAADSGLIPGHTPNTKSGISGYLVCVPELACDHDQGSYVQMVRQALDLIRAGDIYEVNLSRRFVCPAGTLVPEALGLYGRLREASPVPYGAFLDAGAFKVLSASLEMFLDLKQGRARTCPMKGTRPRGRDEQEDDAFLKELQESPKERAELLMVTDLLRNDLGKVCQTGSVAVRQLRAIERFGSLFQATSTVEGRLRAGMDAFDLIEAAFPGGSVTGCPKHRAVEVIDQLERSRRGYYTGALGYIACGGDMMLNMLIRTMILKDGQAHFSTGGGIVADSDPVKEFEETTLKAGGMNKALAG